MKEQRIRVSPDKRAGLIEEFESQGYEVTLDGDEIVVYLGQHKNKRPVQTGKPEKWTKRERNFGYTRSR